MDNWDQYHRNNQQRYDASRYAAHPAPPNSQLLRPSTDQTSPLLPMPEGIGVQRRPSVPLIQQSPLAGPSTSPTARASATLNRLIALMDQHVTQWQPEAIQVACQRMRSSGTPLAYDIGFLANAPLMNMMSHTIEDWVTARRLPCEFYVGFQRLSLMGAQAQRYTTLARCTQYIYAYGLDDSVGPQHPLAHNLLRFGIKPRHGSDLLWYWFLVVDHPYQRMALLGQQRSGYIWNRSFAERVYEGFWTFNPNVTQQIIMALRQAARAVYYN